jgi:hypothetical protein
LKYPPFPWAQNFQDGAHQTTGAQRKIFEKVTIFFGHPVYMQPLVSSLSAGDCPVHRLRKSSFLTGTQDSHLQTVTIPEAAYIQLRRRLPEDEQGNARNM